MRVLIFLFFLSPFAGFAQECRLALVLALDVSGSVNDREYRLQISGLAAALNDPDVRQAILGGGGAHVDLAAFEWSSQNHQFIIQPWVTLDSHAAIDGAVARIGAYRKQRAGLKTALSTAMLFAGELLRGKSECWEHKIDVSADGPNNIGPPVSESYRADTLAGVTVNALVVGSLGDAEPGTLEALEDKDLRQYYEREVIRGPGAFAMIARGYPDYARAMREKLLRELAPAAIGFNR